MPLLNKEFRILIYDDANETQFMMSTIYKYRNMFE